MCLLEGAYQVSLNPYFSYPWYNRGDDLFSSKIFVMASLKSNFLYCSLWDPTVIVHISVSLGGFYLSFSTSLSLKSCHGWIKLWSTLHWDCILINFARYSWMYTPAILFLDILGSCPLSYWFISLTKVCILKGCEFAVGCLRDYWQLEWPDLGVV